MNDFFNAPGVLRGILMIAAGILFSFLLRSVENNTLFLAGSLGCVLLCWFGARPIIEYINKRNE